MKHIFLLLVLLLVGVMPAMADGARLSVYPDTKMITPDKAEVKFDLYLLEDHHEQSFWTNDPVIYIDGKRICKLSQLNVPVQRRGYDKDGDDYDDEIEDWIDDHGRGNLGTFRYNDYISVGARNLRYYDDDVTVENGVKFYDNEYHVDICILIGYNNDGYSFGGKKLDGCTHTIEVKGNWTNNQDDDDHYHGNDVNLNFTTYPTSSHCLPTKAGSVTRQNGSITWTTSGLSAKKINGSDDNWFYHIYLQKEENNPGLFTDGDVESYLDWDVATDKKSSSNSMALDNYQTLTIYPRIVYKNPTGATWEFGGGNLHSYRKDYEKLVVPGFPRPKNIRVNTTDAFAKRVKVSWDYECYDNNNVDTNGKWYIFRKVAGDDSSLSLIGTTFFNSRSFEDKDADKSYYDASRGETTKYEYIVVFGPDNWKIEKPDDAKSLYASQTHQLERTFVISDPKVAGKKNSVDISWQIPSITDASSIKPYYLYLEKRKAEDTSAPWKRIDTETITSPTMVEFSYTDKDNLEVLENYAYRVYINVQDVAFYSNEVAGGIDGCTTVTKFNCSRGSYSNSVNVQWTVDQRGASNTDFILQRKPLDNTDPTAWRTIYSTTGKQTVYTYEDNTAEAGTYYAYHLRISTKVDDEEKGVSDYYADGFSLALGTLSGTVSYGSGTAVEGVHVMLARSDANGEDVSSFRSLKIDSVPNAGIYYKGDLEKLFGKQYTIQMYVYPDGEKMKEAGKEYWLIDAGVRWLQLRKDSTDNRYKLLIRDRNGRKTISSIVLPANEWSHVTMVTNEKQGQIYVHTRDSLMTDNLVVLDYIPESKIDTVLAVGNNADMNSDHHFAGYVDEFRVFTKALSKEEVEKNYNHTLAGSEENLAIYWPMDEAMSSQRIVYDYSKTSGSRNGRIGLLNVPAVSSTIVPDEEMLSLSAYTDKDGNFVVRGIPFTGDGTNYIATPVMGVHKFQPANVSCFVSQNSLAFSGQNFTDVSSFPVSGRVRYDQTTIPVSGASIYVDGEMAVKDGEPVMTNSEGDYTVDVPIGDHFITVKKDGHTFVNNGRYPVDPNDVGVRYTFESEVSHLDFFDNTMVIVAGRVAGGLTENNKPLGVNNGVANIGKAVITLDFKDDPDRAEFIHAVRKEKEASYYYEQDPSRRNFTTVMGNSRAYVPEGKNYIQIETDSITGEFEVMLPPLRYTSSSVVIPSQEEIAFDNQVIDATNPTAEYVDSIENKDGELVSFKYNASKKFMYHSPAVLDIVENANGAFGADSIAASKLDNSQENIPAYTVNADGTIKYTFGYPVYTQMNRYQYEVSGFEEYVNKDGNKDVVYRDPLAYAEVEFHNEFANNTPVNGQTGEVGEIPESEIILDSIGHGTYSFLAGQPNIHSPYTRQIKVSYKAGGQVYEWDGKIEAIVLGALVSGKDFATEGPDKVLLILRDPPGSQSKTTFAKGLTTTYTDKTQSGWHVKLSQLTNVLLGLCGAVAEGAPGFYTINGFRSKYTQTLSESVDITNHKGNSVTYSFTTNQQLSTSASPKFVGARGDLFVGTAENYIFGKSKNLMVLSTGNNYNLIVQDGYTRGEEFTTMFAYSKWEIENKVIPDFIKQRDALLKEVDDVHSVSRPAAGKQPVYVTTLKKTDPNYGINNDSGVWGEDAVTIDEGLDKTTGRVDGPSYSIIFPVDFDTKGYQDMVMFYNSQVANWRGKMAMNECAKVKAIEDPKTFNRRNISFDAGAAVTNSIISKNTQTRDTLLQDVGDFSTGFNFGYALDGLGVFDTVTPSGGINYIYTQTGVVDSTITVTYTLADSDLGDNYSVDVYDAPDGGGPVFYTRAGTSRSPYEDEVKTDYYYPGTVISEKTLQVEKPELVILDPVVTGVPAGSDATFRIKLTNNSETQALISYGLRVAPKSNPNGAQIFMDGKPLVDGVTIGIPYGSMTKTLTLRQADPDVLEYKDITLRLYSTSQPNDAGTFPGIYSDGKLSVEFQPTCSNILLDASTSVVNADNTDPVEFRIYGYDYNMKSLKGVRLEYKGENDADFRTLKEYTKDSTRVKADPNLELLRPLTGTDKLLYSLDLTDHSFSNQNYVFRAVTICDISGIEINNESQEITIVRDLDRPQLIATPTPASGILRHGGDISITFNEDIRNGSITSDGNFVVNGMLNSRKVVHKTALALNDSVEARTQAAIDLNMQSFSADMWLNYSTDGQIYYHGVKDYGMSASVEGGRLALQFEDKKIASDAQLPRDKWIFLHVGYERTDTTASVSAAYAKDDQTVELIKKTPVPVYCGNGPLTVGGTSMVGKIQEFSLWNGYRSMTEAQIDMNKTKNVYTDDLIAYWPFDEGHGLVANDLAHSRNISLNSKSSWWISDLNYAPTLDGQTVLSANIASATTNPGESYLIESWFRADKNQDAAPAIINVGDTLLTIGLDSIGHLQLIANNNATSATTADLRDGAWHHVALNVLKDTKGSAILYLDGQSVMQLSSADVPAVQSEALIIGGHRSKANGMTIYDRFLKGSVDEVRLWKSRRTAEVIRRSMYRRVRTDEDGLVAYYPFEETTIDANNQTVTSGSFADATGKAPIEMAVLQGVAGQKGSAKLSAASTPPLISRMTLENVKFSFVASERTVKINLDEDASRLEGCTVNITAKNIHDLNSNNMQPVTWSVYVKQSTLRWVTKSVNINKDADETTTFNASIRNISGKAEEYNITGLPTWLQVNDESGTLQPLIKQDLTFTINPGLPIGTYYTRIWLVGAQGIELPLNITVRVEGNRPDWKAEEGENTMTVIGNLVIDGIISSDTADMVGAFIGDRCVGVVSPKYLKRFDSYMLMLNISANNADQNKAITYKAYDASTGHIYPIVDASLKNAYHFIADQWIGTYADPCIFSPDDKIQQDLSAKKGGITWISLYVKPENNNVSALFKDVAKHISGVVARDKSAKPDGNSWIGNLTSLNASTMYKVNNRDAYELLVNGMTYDPSKVAITLRPKWSWIGYPVADVNNLGAAFADANPKEGDIVKSQTKFAMFTGGEWVGTLTSMTPGQGYNYFSTSKGVKDFFFPTVTSQNFGAKPALLLGNGNDDVAGFENNMTIVAVVKDGDITISNATVEAYVGNELRGRSGSDITTGAADALHFITVGGGSEQAMLTFIVDDGTETKRLAQQLLFIADAHYGTPENPYVLQMDKATGISSVEADRQIESLEVYSISGELVYKAADTSRLLTADDLQGLKRGVYIQRVAYADGSHDVIKMTKK